MKAKFVVLLIAIALASQAHAQALPGGFVYLRDIDPTILQDIRYASFEQFHRAADEGI